MYIEMIDETGQVSEKLKEQTLELLDFAAQRLGKEDKEMAVTFVTNERSHELNLEYRDTDRPTDVISLEYKPELDISFDEEELAENPELAEMMGEFDSYIGELFISVDKAHEQAEDYGHSFEREMGFLAVHGFLHINGYDHYTPEEEAEMFGLQEEIMDLRDNNPQKKWKNREFTASFEFALTGIITAFKEERNMRKHLVSAILVVLAGLIFRVSATEWLFLLMAVFLVIALEIVNSAIENVVDLASNYHFSMLAKNAKDMAAGAVLVVSCYALITGMIVFIPKIWHLIFN